MASSRHARVKELFLAAYDQAPDSLSSFLDSARGEDQDLRREVDSLLAFDVETAAARATENTADEVGAIAPTEKLDPLPPRIGGYRIIRRLGEGAMGEVFEAEQEEPVQRRVALKVIQLGLGSEEVLARFESERQALALMSHPSIATILDAGQAADGRPYFAMELVRGVPITDYCDSARLSTRERLELGFLPARSRGSLQRR